MLVKGLLLPILSIVLIMPTFVFADATIKYHGSSTILQAIMYKSAAEYNKKSGVTFDLKGQSTSVGIEKLLAGECNLAGGGRPLKDKEKTIGLVETKVFIDAFAVIVNSQNKLDRISTKEFSDILLGNITSWEETSWALAGHIQVVAPPTKSAHYKNLQKILNFKDLPAGSTYAKMTPAVAYDVKDRLTSIGWTSYANVSKKHGIKILELEDNGRSVAINQANVSNGTYPFSQGMYFYTTGQPEGAVKDFIDFIKSPEGESIIQEANFFLP